MVCCHLWLSVRCSIIKLSMPNASSTNQTYDTVYKLFLRLIWKEKISQHLHMSVGGSVTIAVHSSVSRSRGMDCRPLYMYQRKFDGNTWLTTHIALLQRKCVQTLQLLVPRFQALCWSIWVLCSLVPRPLPAFQHFTRNFLVKCWKAGSGLGTRLIALHDSTNNLHGSFPRPQGTSPILSCMADTCLSNCKGREGELQNSISSPFSGVPSNTPNTKSLVRDSCERISSSLWEKFAYQVIHCTHSVHVCNYAGRLDTCHNMYIIH